MGCCMSINTVPEPISTPTPTTSREENNENPLFDIHHATSIAPAKHAADTSIKIVVTTPMYNAHSSSIRSSISVLASQLDLDLDEKRLAFQIKMEFLETEQKLERDEINQMRDKILEKQVKQHQSQRLDKLYEVFTNHATNYTKDKMDIDGFVNALAVFGLVIDFDTDLKQLVFNKFDIDNQNEIDFFDFSSTMAEIMTSHQDDELLLLFQIFDLNKDGFLDYFDIARILLAQNHFAVVATAQDPTHLTQIKYTKQQCLKQARKKIQSNGFADYNEISFSQFKRMMLGKTEKDMMIQWMDYPSNSVVIETPEISQETHAVIICA